MRALLPLSAGAALLFVALGYGGALWFPLDAFAHFRLHLAGGAILIALLALWRRQRRWACVAALAAGGALAGLGPALDPAARPAASDTAVPLRVVFANIYTPNRVLDQAAAALVAHDADIVITAETPAALIEGANALNAAYPYQTHRLRGRWSRHVAIWSRTPLMAPRTQRRMGVKPAFADARVLKDGAALSVVGFHFSWPMLSVQAEQLQWLERVWARPEPPRLIVGDFNAAPWSAALNRMERLSETQIIGGLRRSWNTGWPQRLRHAAIPGGLPIDHGLASASIGVVAAKSAAVPGSDHRAIVLDVLVPRTATGARDDDLD